MVRPCKIPSPTVPNSTRKIRELKFGPRRRPSRKSVTPHKQATKQRPNHQGNTQISSKASQFLPTHGQKHGQDPKRRALSQHSSRTPVPNRTADFIASKHAGRQANQRRPDQKQGPYLDRGGRRRGAGSRRRARGRRLVTTGGRTGGVRDADDGRHATEGRKGRTRRELKGADFLAAHQDSGERNK